MRTDMLRFKIGSSVVGVIAGLYTAAPVACSVLSPQSPACGWPTVLSATALGGVAGAAAGWLIAYRYGPRLITFGHDDTWVRRLVLFALAALVGVWFSAVLEGKGEAYRAWYWLAVFPSLCAASAGLGTWRPTHAWRWGLAPPFGQWLWEIIAHGDQIGIGNLGLFAHVVVFAEYALSAIPCVIAAEIGAYWSRTRLGSAS